VRTAHGLYALADWPVVPARRILAACLATGGVASHASAAWVWGLVRYQQSPPVVSVPHSRHPARPVGPSQKRPLSGSPDLSGVRVYHSRDLSPECTSHWRGVPTTKPLRTLVDLAGDSNPELLDEAIDVALATRLVTVEGLLAEAGRLKRQGRRGPAQLIARLDGRRFTGAPAPSVLESKALRLLSSAGISVDKCEVVVDGGRYRLDIQLEGRLFVELDGYAYHWAPEQKRRDDSRRNRLRVLGFEILVYDWGTVVHEPSRLLGEIKTALGR
jgi:very-short-patch-repair endonuclease